MKDDANKPGTPTAETQRAACLGREPDAPKRSRRKLPVVTDDEPAPHSSDSRRGFLKLMAQTAGITTLLAACDAETRERFFSKNFRELSPASVKRLVTRLERDYKKEFGVDVTVGVEPPIPGVVFAYALDLGRCVGCRRCVHACVEENNQSREPEIQYIRVLEMEKRHGVDLHYANAYYEAEEVPRKGHFYFPVACQQCDKSPCHRVCPVGATWKEPDGVVVIDYDWCIGCRYCMAACPYGARRFNWAKPTLPKKDLNPDTHILGNRPRAKGVVEKCHFCLQRTRKGRYPACLEVCPVGARKFGNLLDPDSEIRKVIETKRIFVFKDELNTQPKFFYFYGA